MARAIPDRSTQSSRLLTWFIERCLSRSRPVEFSHYAAATRFTWPTWLNMIGHPCNSNHLDISPETSQRSFTHFVAWPCSEWTLILDITYYITYPLLPKRAVGPLNCTVLHSGALHEASAG